MKRILSCLAWLFLFWSISALANTHTLGGDFTLTKTDGNKVSLSSFKGKVVLLYFGFTFCPVMCPTEMLKFKQIVSKLPEDRRADVQPIFISVDPKRDTPEILDSYTRFFGNVTLALTGSEKQLRNVADQYHAQFRYIPSGSSYTVDHTSSTFLIDTTGDLVRVIPYGTSTDEMLKLVEALLPPK